MDTLGTIFHAIFRDYWPATVVIVGAFLAWLGRELQFRRKIREHVESEGFQERRKQPRRGDSGAIQQVRILGRRVDALEQEFKKVGAEMQQMRDEVQDIGKITTRVEVILAKQEVHDREIGRLRDRFHTLVNTGEETLHEARMTLEKILMVAEQIKERA